MVTKKDIAAALCDLGVKKDRPLLVHSSLSAFGQVDGGADTVIDALSEAVLPDGTLVMPSFNHGDVYQAGDIYDVKTTKTTNGIIPDTFWRRPGVMRSLASTHAFAAQGKKAKQYLENHHKTSPMGKGSPIDYMFADDGYVLLLGVDFTANSFHHYVEEMMGAPCLSLSDPYPVRDSERNIIHVPTWKWRSAGCPYSDMGGYRIQMPMYTDVMSRIAQHAQVGGAGLMLYNMREGFDVISSFFREGGEGFPPCKYCAIRPTDNWF